MTNKLPEIGARYRWIHLKEEVTVVYINKCTIATEDKDLLVSGWDIGIFFSNFEPIPKEQDHISQEGKKVDKVEEAMEALREMKNCLLPHTMQELINHVRRLESRAELLLDALDEMSKKDDNLPMKEESIDEVPYCEICDNILADPSWCSHCKKEPVKKIEESSPKSIWKNISELPDNQMVIMKNRANYFRIGELYEDEFYFIEADYGEVVYHKIAKGNIEEYCTLTDFINQQEQNAKDIAELKQLITGK